MKEKGFRKWEEVRDERFTKEEVEKIREETRITLEEIAKEKGFSSWEDYKNSLPSENDDNDNETEEPRNIGDELIEGLKNAIEYAKGDKSKGKIWVPADRTKKSERNAGGSGSIDPKNEGES